MPMPGIYRPKHVVFNDRPDIESFMPGSPRFKEGDLGYTNEIVNKAMKSIGLNDETAFMVLAPEFKTGLHRGKRVWEFWLVKGEGDSMMLCKQLTFFDKDQNPIEKIDPVRFFDTICGIGPMTGLSISDRIRMADKTEERNERVLAHRESEASGEFRDALITEETKHASAKSKGAGPKVSVPARITGAPGDKPVGAKPIKIEDIGEV